MSETTWVIEVGQYVSIYWIMTDNILTPSFFFIFVVKLQIDLAGSQQFHSPW